MTKERNPLLDLGLKLDDRIIEMLYAPEQFAREDESDDAVFHAAGRPDDPLDSAALATVERLVDGLVTEEGPEILDLMAGADSHLPPRLAEARMTGLGLDASAMDRNPALDERVIHDLNAEPTLPLPDDAFDVVLCTLAVEALTRPFEVFRDVGRVLRPGGLFLVIFSNRFHAPKAVEVWKQASPPERVMLLEDFFGAVGGFTATAEWSVQGRPRPADDRYAKLGVPSDPVFAVYAESEGGAAGRPGRKPPETAPTEDVAAVEARKAEVADTMCCPHCETPLTKIKGSGSSLSDFEELVIHVCFNDTCPHVLAGWDVMAAQGNLGYSHRFMFLPGQKQCGSLPVTGLQAMKDCIIED